MPTRKGMSLYEKRINRLNDPKKKYHVKIVCPVCGVESGALKTFHTIWEKTCNLCKRNISEQLNN